MRSNRTVRSALGASLAGVVALLLFATSAHAVIFVEHVQLYSGQSWSGGPYYGSVTAVSARSHGVAFSGTWVSNGNGARVSELDYCETPGCTAQIGWVGAKPNGYGTVHNHGNASVSYFAGAIS